MLTQYQVYDIAKADLAARNARRKGAWVASRTRIEWPNLIARALVVAKNLLSEGLQPRRSTRFVPGGSPAR